MIFHSVQELTGRTPLVELCRYAAARGLKARIFAKLEGFNPAGSVKDRVAKEMIEDAEAHGLRAGATLIEPTSGNTGIGLAAMGAAKGYRVILTMPETMSAERRALIRGYGAKIVLTEGAKGMRGAIERAEQLRAEIADSVILGQFTNPANPAAHRKTTAPEIWQDMEGDIDAFVAGVGTGGTITGVGSFLREKIPSVHIVAVEPAASPVLSGGKAGAHGIQGIGAGFIPDVLDRSVYDEVIAVTEADAYAAGRALGREEGILAGISAGAALFAATKLAERSREGARIVVLLPDGGEKYLSTPLFGE